MVRILFMPFLQIPSGHHHVADCIQDQLHQSAGEFDCVKVELLSFSFGTIEKLVSSFYLYWIQRFPTIYSQVYKRVVVKKEKPKKNYFLYEVLFLKQVQRILEQTKPDLVICTHSLPSYLLSSLKKRDSWSGTVINVYTDYFINELWGMDEINYHFIPSMDVKNQLLERGMKPDQVFVTGIPVHPSFRVDSQLAKEKTKYTVLISGGNMGAGSIQKLLNRLHPSGTIRYQVLCGKNQKLFQSVDRLNHPSIQAIPYISSKEEMNRLYDQADAIITKPGGVTMSECLWKRIPIFVYEALPGQEEINLNYLKNQGLIFHLDNWNTLTDLEPIIINRIKNDTAPLHDNLKTYINNIENHDIPHLIQKIL
ncbi:MGDG synthase family glycosyltransferase [Oceanobacillus saliphilus]|uniref:MGDG synthase family glycosyltransferase n=1 Tax=Oceanobacillus saliphilus TaxID=2925834 RepID=UPI00201D44B4|nr:hypothetical protein [Oceanobacillus saliphilus]